MNQNIAETHAPPAAARAELDQLQEGLATRRSTTCFAQSAIALVIALILAGAAGKLFWDSLRTPLLGGVAAVAALGLAGFAVSRYVRGKACLQDEFARYERMQGLRRQLRLDDPSALLPDR